MKIKTIIDYLMENGIFKDCIGTLDVSLRPRFGYVEMCVNEETSYDIEAESTLEFQNIIQDILDKKHKTEVRFCEECGKPYDRGFMAGDGDWYCCEDCFEDSMNKIYGKDNWRSTDEEGYYGGYYESLQDDGAWEDTGVFYTEWN